ncbi:MAG TPA: glycosyltransferase family 2 protein [Candidatus Omnitrophota bacterium]|nr:glycosyltransferase family 2 protein [Candidatus Omnitrophota bacterium]
MKVSLLIPTLNEVEGLKQIMPRIKNEWVDQILVADGGSTDGTIEYLREAGYPFIIQRNRGLRYAYIEAIGLLQAEVVITFSPDGNSVPELIPELIEKMKDGYDMVIVSRYKDEAKSYDDDRITAFGNWLFTKMINLLHKGKYTDSLVMFRAWRKDIFKELGLDQEASYAAEERLFGTRVGVEPLLSIRAAKRKLRCAEIAGDEPPRIGGKRKLRIIRWGLAYMFEVFREAF